MDEKFNDLIKKRKNLINSLKDNNAYYGLMNNLINLYPDNAHFIYELLQNAEDPEATSVKFTLSQTQLKFEHNGKRKFQFEDIESITNIGNSTKSSDTTSIGKFGIGFKAVYAYTHTPQIHSGEYHFHIEDMMIPEIIQNSFPKDSMTRFKFPFNHTYKKSEIAYKEVRDGLLGLQDTSILFLKNIKKIEIQILENDLLTIEKRHLNDNLIEIVHKYNNIQTLSNWLLYHKEVDIQTVLTSNQKFKVSIAFKLKQNKETQNFEISSDQNGKVFIFFPAEKESFDLNFHVNAPFASPVSRSNILDSDENLILIDCLSNLFCDSIEDLKNKNLLNKDAYKLFPIDINRRKKNKYYNIFYENIKKKLEESDILLSTEKSFSNFKNLFIAEDEIVTILFKGEQLQDIFSEKKSWIDKSISSIPEFKKFLKDELILPTLNLRKMIDNLNDHFFSKQDDDWLIAFYSEISNPKDLPNLLNKSFLRLENNEMVRPFEEDKTPCAYLNQNSINTSFPIIKKSLTNNKKAYEFFKKLDLDNVDEFAELYHNIIPLYEKSNSLISREDHLSHLSLIQKCLNSDSEKKKRELLNKLNNIRFIKNSKGNYNKPNELYLYKSELNDYFQGNSMVNFINSEIYNEEHFKIFKDLSISDEVRVSYKNPSSPKGFVEIDTKRGFKRGINRFDPFFTVDGLVDAIKNITVQKSIFIWNNILLKYSNYIKGTVQFSYNKFQFIANEETIESERFGKILKYSKWLPDKYGKFHFPNELKFSDLHEGFNIDENIILLLNMKNDIDKLAKEAGVSVESIKYAQLFEKLSPQDKEKNLNQIERDFFKTPPQFPSNKVNNPDLRENKTKLQYLNEEEKTYQESIRSNRSSTTEFNPKEYLYGNYKNLDEQLICQICKLEMPFKKRDGKHYFEKKEIFTKSMIIKESHIPYLALCPVCAAKYQEFIKSDETKLIKIKKSILETDLDEIDITLGEEITSIKFVEKHILDLRSLLKEVSK